MHARDIFLNRLPKKPFCADNPRDGLQIRSTSSALTRSHIQANPPHEITWLAFDIDYEGAAYAWEFGNLPPPTITIVNPENAHAHLLYGLKTPVLLSDNARYAPRAYAAAIRSAFTARLKADPAYSGQIVKNPIHERWRVIWVNRLYELGELAEYVDLRRDKARQISEGEGRNVNLFRNLRAWAFKHVSAFKRQGGREEAWAASLLSQAESLNSTPNPLPYSEVRSVARSVARWTWRNPNCADFSAKQSARGKLGGRPPTVTANGKPWEEQGINRSTWYRRQRKSK